MSSKDLIPLMPTQEELDQLMVAGELILCWESFSPSARIKDHEMEDNQP